MDTYASPYGARLNHAMLGLHAVLSLGFVLPGCLACWRLTLVTWSLCGAGLAKYNQPMEVKGFFRPHPGCYLLFLFQWGCPGVVPLTKRCFN